MTDYFCYQLPIGYLTIFSKDAAIIEVKFAQTSGGKENKILQEAYQQLQEYFRGERKVFNLSMQPNGTDFQKKVWEKLTTIGFGETISYQDLADAIGNKKACRAVGNANNKNPLPIFIPCHRVVGKSGKLVGYAGGLEVKKQLLELEQKCQ